MVNDRWQMFAGRKNFHQFCCQFWVMTDFHRDRLTFAKMCHLLIITGNTNVFSKWNSVMSHKYYVHHTLNNPRFPKTVYLYMLIFLFATFAILIVGHGLMHTLYDCKSLA